MRLPRKVSCGWSRICATGAPRWKRANNGLSKIPTASFTGPATLLADALASGDIAGTLAKLAPTHPDYARLRDELAITPESDAAKRKLIRANMDRWRWLARDLGPQYLITNVPRIPAAPDGQGPHHQHLSHGRRQAGAHRHPRSWPRWSKAWFSTRPGRCRNRSSRARGSWAQKVLANPAWAKAQRLCRQARGRWLYQRGAAARAGQFAGADEAGDAQPARDLISTTRPRANLFANDSRALSHGCIRTERALELAITMAILARARARTRRSRSPIRASTPR